MGFEVSCLSLREVYTFLELGSLGFLVLFFLLCFFVALACRFGLSSFSVALAWHPCRFSMPVPGTTSHSARF